MFKSLRTKIIILIIALIILLVGGISASLIHSKYKELRDDIARGVHSFAQMATRPLMDNFELYFDSGFLKFSDEVRQTLELDSDISKIQIAKYNGEIVYDSVIDATKKYQGEPREANAEVLPAIQKIEPSYLLTDGTDAGWNTIPDEQISEAVYPFLDDSRRHEYTVLYSVTYQNLYARLANTAIQITILALIGVAVGILAAFFFARTLTRPLAYLKKKADEIGAGNLDVEIEVQTKDEIGALAETLGDMADELKESQAAMIENEKHEHEISLASEIQQKLLPEKIPELKNAEIAAMVRPADDVGGDVYDLILREPGKMLFYVGGVTGHGVPAGLVSGMTNALAFGFAPHLKKITDLADSMNATMYPKTKKGMYVTMVMGTWDDDTRELTYTSGGHEPALHFDARKKEVVELQKGGSPLGMFPKPLRPFTENKLKLKKGDLVVFYTDGVNEAWNPREEQFEMERFKQVVMEAAQQNLSAQEIQEKILAAVDEFREEFEQKDDITLLVVLGR